jgi:hypothetical protein
LQFTKGHNSFKNKTTHKLSISQLWSETIQAKAIYQTSIENGHPMWRKVWKTDF